MSATRCGISAKQIERETGVTYKTAWRMFHQIRSLLQDNPEAGQGEFEVDETYIGGVRPGEHGRGAEGKTPVFGMVQRKGMVKALKSKDLKRATVYPLIKQYIQPESTIYTDEFHTYATLSEQGYKHQSVKHSLKQWSKGKACEVVPEIWTGC